MAPITVKVSNENNDIRRFTLADDEQQFGMLQDKVAKIFHLSGDFKLRWTDDEGDVVCCSDDEEMHEAIGVARTATPSILRLSVALSAANEKVPKNEVNEKAPKNEVPNLQTDWGGQHHGKGRWGKGGKGWGGQHHGKGGWGKGGKGWEDHEHHHGKGGMGKGKGGWEHHHHLQVDCHQLGHFQLERFLYRHPKVLEKLRLLEASDPAQLEAKLARLGERHPRLKAWAEAHPDAVGELMQQVRAGDQGGKGDKGWDEHRHHPYRGKGKGGKGMKGGADHLPAKLSIFLANHPDHAARLREDPEAAAQVLQSRPRLARLVAVHPATLQEALRRSEEMLRRLDHNAAQPHLLTALRSRVTRFLRHHPEAQLQLAAAAGLEAEARFAAVAELFAGRPAMLSWARNNTDDLFVVLSGVQAELEKRAEKKALKKATKKAGRAETGNQQEGGKRCYNSAVEETTSESEPEVVLGALVDMLVVGESLEDEDDDTVVV